MKKYSKDMTEFITFIRNFPEEYLPAKEWSEVVGVPTYTVYNAYNKKVDQKLQRDEFGRYGYSLQTLEQP